MVLSHTKSTSNQILKYSFQVVRSRILSDSATIEKETSNIFLEKMEV